MSAPDASKSPQSFFAGEGLPVDLRVAVGLDGLAHDRGQDVGRRSLSLGGGGAGERALVGRLRRSGRQVVGGDLLGGDRDPLELHLGPRGLGERDHVLGERVEQVLATRVVVADVSPELNECASLTLPSQLRLRSASGTLIETQLSNATVRKRR
ncbi:hypothetical protein [Streptomyces sp. NPDC093097]|uniref:hypothetical protein n=1 Tax=Streptomyces sp. NPDC093097 TaxID=3366027 RepID=UPI00381027B6